MSIEHKIEIDTEFEFTSDKPLSEFLNEIKRKIEEFVEPETEFAGTIRVILDCTKKMEFS